MNIAWVQQYRFCKWLLLKIIVLLVTYSIHHKIITTFFQKPVVHSILQVPLSRCQVFILTEIDHAQRSLIIIYLYLRFISAVQFQFLTTGLARTQD